jgi:hypothetical protein
MPVMNRCGRCEACKRIKLAKQCCAPNPPFNHASQSTIDVWNRTLEENPCQSEDRVACATCGRNMPSERLELGLAHCSNCTNQTAPKGAMEYNHKTAGVLIVTDEKGFSKLKKTAGERR